MTQRRWLLLFTGLLLAGCASDTSAPAAREAAPASSTSEPRAEPSVTSPTTTAEVPITTTPPAPPAIAIPLRLVRQTTDAATQDFVGTTTAALTDSRGWEQAGFEFTFREDAPFTVLLAEPDVVDATCAPYDVQSTYSCQIGPIVVLNADRWRSATPTWPGTLEEYRIMLVNHEVGHLLGQHHPAENCVPAGTPAAVMAQQSKGLDGCVSNAWPLTWEVACASRHQEPIAPGYEPDSVPSCGPHDVG